MFLIHKDLEAFIMSGKEIFKPKRLLSAAIITAMLVGTTALADQQSAAIENDGTETVTTAETTEPSALSDVLTINGSPVSVKQFWEGVTLDSSGKFVYHDPNAGEDIVLTAEDLNQLKTADGAVQSAMAEKLNSIDSTVTELNNTFSGADTGDNTEGMFQTISKQLTYLAKINGYSSDVVVPATIDTTGTITSGGIYILGGTAATEGKDVAPTSVVVKCVKILDAETYDGETKTGNADGSTTITPVHVTTPSSAVFQTFGLTYGSWPGNGDLKDKYGNLLGEFQPLIKDMYLPEKHINETSDNKGDVTTTEPGPDGMAVMSASIKNNGLYGLPVTAGAWFINQDAQKNVYYMGYKTVERDDGTISEINNWEIDNETNAKTDDKLIAPYFTISDLSKVNVINGIIEPVSRLSVPKAKWIDQPSKTYYANDVGIVTTPIGNYGLYYVGTGSKCTIQYAQCSHCQYLNTKLDSINVNNGSTMRFVPNHSKCCPNCGFLMSNGE